LNNRSYIGMGGNLGDVADTFRAARDAIAAWPGCTLLDASRCYRTPPLGPAGQPDYLNAVIAIASTLPPGALLDALQSIEQTHGRERGERWGARTLDLDIIAIGDRIIASERLTVPHPEMHKRQFVLRPLCDIEPAWRHPQTGLTAKAMLEKLLQSGEDPLPEGSPW